MGKKWLFCNICEGKVPPTIHNRLGGMCRDCYNSSNLIEQPKVKYPREWEKITVCVGRLKVFGGWLVNSSRWEITSSIYASQTMCFVPDPNHEWELEEERK